MNWKDFTTDTMIQLARTYLSGAVHEKLQSIPKTAVYLPDLRESLDSIIAARRSPGAGPLEKKLAANRAAATTRDKRHDRKARGIDAFLDGLSDLADDPNEADHYMSLHERLLPRGRSITLLSYDDEAGNAVVVRKELDAPTRAELKKIKTTKDRTLAEDVHDWLAEAEALGALETERRELEQAIGASDAPKPADELRARFDWINAMRGIENGIRTAKIEETEKVALLAHPREAEKKLSRRAPAETPETPEAPVPAEAAAGDEAADK